MSIVKVAVGGEQLNRRRGRYPSYPFNTIARPTQLVPNFIAPVLPNETLTSLNTQARVVTDPIVNSISGWWYETFAFYVKLSAIDPDLPHQFLPGESITRSNYQVTADDAAYFLAASVTNPSHNWLELCMDRIAEEWFHLPGETNKLDSYHTRRLMQEDWTQSAIIQTAVDNPAIGADVETVDDQIRAFRAMLMDQSQNMDFDEYLRQYGVRSVNSERGIPEPIFSSKNWAFPSNTIDPTDGSATSAVSWLINAKMKSDKKVYCKEPGFIVGCTAFTPKVFRTGVKGTLTGELWGPEMWMSPIHVPDAAASIVEMANGHDIMPAVTGPIYFDFADLFNHGESFTNHTGMPSAALPADGDLVGSFLSSTDADALFVNAVGGYKYARADGITTLGIQSSLRDNT